VLTLINLAGLSSSFVIPTFLPPRALRELRGKKIQNPLIVAAVMAQNAVLPPEYSGPYWTLLHSDGILVRSAE
jgi:hypothetical protein